MVEELTFVINHDSPIAVYAQLENQVQFAVASGRLKPGDKVPSVREMSAMLDTNPNTVTKAYHDLELLQVVHTRRGVGVTITQGAPRLCRASMRALVNSHLTDAVAEGRAAGWSREAVIKIVDTAIRTRRRPYQP